MWWIGEVGERIQCESSKRIEADPEGDAAVER